MSSIDLSTVKACGQLACDDIYDPVTPNVFGKVYRVGESTCGTVLVGDTLFIAYQGTENRAGWIADFDIAPICHPVLGNLHSGFYQNLPELITQIGPDIPVGIKIIVIGHSKGAGEAAQAGPLLMLAGFNVVQLIMFACPNAGCQMLADWIAKNVPGSVSYRNAMAGAPEFGDPVPCVPVKPYVPPVPHTMIDQPPAGALRLIDVEWHKGALYIAGLKNFGSIKQ